MKEKREDPPNPAARAVLKEKFGFDGFRPGQERLVGSVLAGRDTLGVLPTGGGKTLCYQLPAFMMSGLVVVVSPLISLMQDQVDRARRLGLRAASLTSQDPKDAQKRNERAIADGALDLLFCSPERLEARRLRGLLTSSPVSLITIDEAHCISECPGTVSRLCNGWPGVAYLTAPQRFPGPGVSRSCPLRFRLVSPIVNCVVINEVIHN